MNAVTPPVYFANMALLYHQASPSRRSWLETALFTALAGNPPLP